MFADLRIRLRALLRRDTVERELELKSDFTSTTTSRS